LSDREWQGKMLGVGVSHIINLNKVRKKSRNGTEDEDNESVIRKTFLKAYGNISVFSAHFEPQKIHLPHHQRTIMGTRCRALMLRDILTGRP